MCCVCVCVCVSKQCMVFRHCWHILLREWQYESCANVLCRQNTLLNVRLHIVITKFTIRLTVDVSSKEILYCEWALWMSWLFFYHFEYCICFLNKSVVQFLRNCVWKPQRCSFRYDMKCIPKKNRTKEYSNSETFKFERLCHLLAFIRMKNSNHKWGLLFFENWFTPLESSM